MTSTELELELNLDAESRTTFDPSSLPSKQAGGSDNVESLPIDYSSKTVLTSLADDTCVEIFAGGDEINNDDKKETKQKILDDMLFDCEITDCALLPRTFWMPCTDMKVRS